MGVTDVFTILILNGFLVMLYDAKAHKITQGTITAIITLILLSIMVVLGYD